MTTTPRTLPTAMRAYIAITAFCAVVVALALAVTSELPRGADALIAAQVLTLVFLAKCYPVPLAPKRKLSLNTAPMLAAIVLLQPCPAVLSVAAGMLAGELWRRSSRAQTTFNVSVALLYTAIGAFVLRM